MDLVKIAAGAAAECERQQVGIQELAWLLEAYRYAYDNKDTGYCTESPEDIKVLGRMVEPAKNNRGFRKTPVTFRDGGTSAEAADIPRLMRQWIERLPDFEDKSNAVREFLWIHPFRDGNGRVGWLLYNYLRGTMDSPDPLPYYFGEA